MAKGSVKKRSSGREGSKSLLDKHLPDVLETDFERLEHARNHLKEIPSFYQRVYAIVQQIPRGKVTTYGAIAEVLGMKRSSRMVGQALNAVPKDLEVPAQRVINRMGALSGAHHFGGYDIMRGLLVKEGVRFKDERVDMESHFWDPASAEQPWAQSSTRPPRGNRK